MCTKLLVVSVYARAIKRDRAMEWGTEDTLIALSWGHCTPTFFSICDWWTEDHSGTH
jgi:hypothetical protein